MAEAPAPLKTILTSSIFRSAIFKALIRPARATTAVPCWSSWKTGISSRSHNRLLDFEAPGRGDVLQVNAGENRRDVLHHLHDPVGFLGADANGKGLHPAEGFKQDGLAFHHRQRRPGADVPQAQDRAAIRDDGHQVILAGVVIGAHGFLEDLGADLGHGLRGIQAGDK